MCRNLQLSTMHEHTTDLFEHLQAGTGGHFNRFERISKVLSRMSFRGRLLAEIFPFECLRGPLPANLGYGVNSNTMPSPTIPLPMP